MTDRHDRTLQVFTIVAEIKPLLAGQGPDVQGAVLAELLGLWLAGHRPDTRDELLALHLQFVEQLVCVNDQCAAEVSGFHGPSLVGGP
jgi:hypothetical protein